jgi:putative nucleotidyltransferase with HDIG domain
MSDQYRAYLDAIGFAARARLAMWVGLVAYVGFTLLDYLVAGEYFSLFVLLRVIGAVTIVGGAVLLGTAWGRSRGVFIGLVVLIVPLLGIGIMIQLMDPTLLSYYQGLILVVIFMPTFFMWDRRASGLVCVVAFSVYAVPSLLFYGSDPEVLLVIAGNCFFLGTACAIVYVGAGVMFDARFHEFLMRRELETTRSDLESNNWKLRELDRLKTQFFSNVSHELRTPLTLLLAPLGALLERGVADDTGTRETLAMMQRNGLRLLRLINNLLDFTKLEALKVRLRIKQVDLIDYLGTLLKSVQPLAEEKGIRLEFVHPEAPVDVPLDPEQFEKVVLNLLANAVKFTPSHGTITVTVEAGTEWATLVVEDSGEGIPENMLSAVFDRFQQVNGSPTRRFGGTGIGLALAKEIVNLHQGTICAEKKAGPGARLVVRMQRDEQRIPLEVRDRRQQSRPVTVGRRAADKTELDLAEVVRNPHALQLADLMEGGTAGAPAPADLAPPARASARAKDGAAHEHTILIVDDTPDVLRLMRLLLAPDYDILLECDPRAALHVVRSARPDLVICDVMMPEMDGYAFCREVRADPNSLHTPVMLVTARTESECLVQGIDAGADDYLAKPFDPAELRARVRALLRMREAEVTLARVNQNLRQRTSDLVDRQRELLLATIRALISALDAKDHYTRHHSTRVTEYALAIANRMGLAASEVRDLELAGWLHDIGKIAVPEGVLNKPERLNDEELRHIRVHPSEGARILEPVVELNRVSEIVRWHHERYDGSGYPDGLAKLAIPIGARILAVADTYDAMTSDRPYRRGMAHNVAVKEIVRCSGAQFDPEIVDHFLALSEELRRRQSEKTQS